MQVPRIAVLLLVAVVAGAVSCTGGSNHAATPSPHNTALATALPTAATATPPGPGTEPGLLIGATQVARGVIAPAVASLPNIAFIVERGCINCDGSITGLDRVWFDGTGVPHTDVLFRPSEMPDGYITSTVVSPDASHIVLGECVRGWCGGMGGDLYPDARVAVRESRDGGITWTEIARIDGWVFPVALAEKGVLLRVIEQVRDATGKVPSYFLEIPGNRRLAPPVDAGPYVAPVGQGPDWLWAVYDRAHLWNRDGSLHFDYAAVSGTATRPGAFISGVATGSSGNHVVAIQPGTSDTLLLHLDSHGTVSSAFAIPSLGWFHFAALLPAVTPPTIAGTAIFPGNTYGLPSAEPYGQFSLPFLYNADTGTVTPIAGPFLPGNGKPDRNDVIGAIAGPMVRVKTNGEDCLPVRAQPSETAPLKACFEDGVLLRPIPNPPTDPQPPDYDAWRALQLPAGEVGWIPRTAFDALQ